MKMPFRDDLSALETRRETLQAELAQVQEQKRELAGLDAREKQLQQSLDATKAVLAGMGHGGSGAKRSLLDNVSIASPCPASWDNMQGNGRVRYCLQCEKNVYNLSAMPREEAEELLHSRGDVCVRLYRRTDGTVMTADCPVGMKIRRAKQRKFALLGIGAAIFSSGLASALAARISCPAAPPGEAGFPTMGQMPIAAHSFNDEAVASPDSPDSPNSPNMREPQPSMNTPRHFPDPPLIKGNPQSPPAGHHTTGVVARPADIE